MSGESILLTIAQIGVAIAGFSSVVAVFGRRTGTTWSRADRFRLSLMIEFSLAAALFAFVPLCIHYVDEEPTVVWTTSSLLLTVFLVAQVVSVVQRIRPLGSERRSLRRWLAAFMVVCLNGALLLQLANVLNIGFHREFAPYLIGLVLMLMASAAQFARLIFLGITAPDA